MKITRVETKVVGAPTPGNGKLSNKNYLFVLVHTDEGITGLGEATLGGYTKAVVDIIDSFAEFLIGQDPTRIEYLLQVLTRQKFWRGGVIKGSAVAGVELALWDILGKSLDAPVYKLVGGACRDKLRVYVNGWTGGATDPAEVLDKLEAALAAGYENFKFSIAEPSWPVKDTRVTRMIVAVAETIRGRIGPERLLMFDGHGRYDPASAIAIGNALRDVDLLFFEEPVSQLDEKAMAQVARQVPMPLAAGERLENKFEFRRLLELEAIRVVQPDVAHCNGFSEAWKIASLGDAFSAFLAPHCPLSPVLTSVSAHLDAAAPNFLIQERLFLNDWRNEIILDPIRVQDGFLPLPKGPGWGVELNEAVCARNPPVEDSIPRLFRPDGAVCDW